MGGPGSGRHDGVKKRRVESCLALDANELRREGALTQGACGTLSLGTDHGALSLAFRAEADALVLLYRAEHIAASEVIEQRVAQAYSSANFGGTRSISFAQAPSAADAFPSSTSYAASFVAAIVMDSLMSARLRTKGGEHDGARTSGGRGLAHPWRAQADRGVR
jgi:hypothetical protein